METKNGMTLAEGYLSVAKLIHGVCWKFLKRTRFGRVYLERNGLPDGDRDRLPPEIVSVAFFVFAERVWSRWDPEMTVLTNWTMHNMWWGLLRWANREAKRENRTQWINGHDFEDKRTFDLEALTKRMSRDATIMVTDAVRKSWPQRGGGSKTAAMIKRFQLRGWDGERIEEAIREVQEVLS